MTIQANPLAPLAERLRRERNCQDLYDLIDSLNNDVEILSRGDDNVASLRRDLAEDPPGERSDRARRLLGLAPDNPAIVACVGLQPACAANGCQGRR